MEVGGGVPGLPKLFNSFHVCLSVLTIFAFLIGDVEIKLLKLAAIADYVFQDIEFTRCPFETLDIHHLKGAANALLNPYVI